MPPTNSHSPQTALRMIASTGLLWLILLGTAWLIAGCGQLLATPTATLTPSASATSTLSPEPASATPTRRPVQAGPVATPIFPNLALNRPATSSSEENGMNTTENAVDGNLITRWSSKYSDPQWIAVDLGAKHAIQHITLQWEASGLDYQLQVSDDAANWTDVYSTINGADGGGYKVIDEVDVSASGRYVRMYGTKRSSTWGFSLYEFAVYEQWETPPTSTPRPTSTLETPTVTPPAGLTLVWHDEFEGHEINPDNWTYDLGAGANHIGFNTNLPENSYVQNGNLIIELRKEANGELCLGGPCQYTTAQLRTSGLQSWQYGRIEARIKVPEGWGVWPAFWMMGDNGNWPDCGEVDIMEMIGGAASGREDTNYGTMHWGDDGHLSSGGADQLPGQKFASQYHVYALEWDSNEFRWYLDDDPVPFYTARNNESGMDEFHQPFFLLLNVAVGGAWAGMPHADNIFPQRMAVDWVRVYQKPEWLYTPTPTPTGLFSRKDTSSAYLLHTGLTGTLTSEFDLTPLEEGFTGFIGYNALGSRADYYDYPALIRLNILGTLEVRNGSTFAALEPVHYSLYQTYHFKVVLSLDDQTANVWVTPPGGAPIQIAQDYVFNPQAPRLTEVGQLLLHSDKDNQFRVSNHFLTAQP